MKLFVLEPGTEVRTENGVERAVVSGQGFHYLARVRRLKSGSELKVLFEGSPRQARIVKVEDASLVIEISRAEPSNPRQEVPPLHLMACLLKGRKLDEVVRQAAELGAVSFQPIQSDYCIARWDEKPNTKWDRWKAIAREAAQQSGSSQVMEILPVQSLEYAVKVWNNKGPLLFFHQVPLVKASLHGYLSCRPENVGVLVGPEGGLSDRETEYLNETGACPVWFGSSVLRSETAGTAALAAVKILLLERSEWTTRF